MALALRTLGEVAAPILLTALLVGLVIGILQAATQVQEASVNFVPKLAATALAIALGGSFFLDRLGGLLRAALHSIAGAGP